jgi:hypothetical protein
MAQGSPGLGEAYMDGWWDCPKMDSFFFRVMRARLDKQIKTIPFFSIHPFFKERLVFIFS